ncbi:MAG TPA: CapA family protein, partial [Acidimicrobiales bacterium]
RRAAGLVAAAVLVVAGVGAWRLAGAPRASGAAASTTTTTASAPTSTTTTVPPTLTLAAVGDTELGNTPTLPGDPATWFDPVRSALAAPIVFGNLEGTLTDATTSKCGAAARDCYAFKVPPSYAAIYRAAGFTVLNSANNHSDDFGPAGVASTSAALRAAGIVQAGLPGQIGLVREGPVRVAFCDFAPYVLTNDLLDTSAAAQLIARARAEADVVVVYMHAGAEGASADHVTRQSEYFLGEDRGNPYAFAHFAIDHGADLVIASGPHVLRGMEWYRGHLIAYSLGDFANYEDFSSAGTLALSGILHVTLSAGGRFLGGRFTSLLLAPDGRASVDPHGAAAAFVDQLSREDFGPAAALIRADGSIAPPA